MSYILLSLNFLAPRELMIWSYFDIGENWWVKGRVSYTLKKDRGRHKYKGFA
jgi:hypothetical protein